MGGDYPRTGSGGAHGGDQGESVRNVVRVERTDHQRDAGVLPDSGTDSGDRVRAPAAWGRPDDAHPYDLPGSDERLREEVSGALSTVDEANGSERAARAESGWRRGRASAGRVSAGHTDRSGAGRH